MLRQFFHEPLQDDTDPPAPRTYVSTIYGLVERGRLKKPSDILRNLIMFRRFKAYNGTDNTDWMNITDWMNQTYRRRDIDLMRDSFTRNNTTYSISDIELACRGFGMNDSLAANIGISCGMVLYSPII
jgi:hypothetical protein